MTMENDVKNYMAAYPYATFVYQELSKVFRMRYDCMLNVLRMLQTKGVVSSFKNKYGEVRWHIVR